MPKEDDSGWAKFGALGLEIAIGLGLGALIGAWIDKKYGTNPWGVVIGAAVGFAAGMYALIKAGMKANRN
jgi:F0F1-type ATP synthase assembly protein I